MSEPKDDLGPFQQFMVRLQELGLGEYGHSVDTGDCLTVTAEIGPVTLKFDFDENNTLFNVREP